MIAGEDVCPACGQHVDKDVYPPPGADLSTKRVQRGESSSRRSPVQHVRSMHKTKSGNPNTKTNIRAMFLVGTMCSFGLMLFPWLLWEIGTSDMWSKFMSQGRLSPFEKFLAGIVLIVAVLFMMAMCSAMSTA